MSELVGFFLCVIVIQSAAKAFENLSPSKHPNCLLGIPSLLFNVCDELIPWVQSAPDVKTTIRL
jgi:hypothetical protein